jgi:CRP-like cAMP-binding protein
MDLENLSRLRLLHPLLAQIDEVSFRASAPRCRHLLLRPGRRILRPDLGREQVFFLLRGSVRLSLRHEGHELMLMLARAPAVLGDSALLPGNGSGEEAVTLEPSELLGFDRADVAQWLSTNSGLARAMAMDALARLRLVSLAGSAHAFGDISRRLAGVLLDYAAVCGRTTTEGLLLDHKLTQERLAGDIGVSRRSLHRALVELKTAGLLRRDGTRFVLSNLSELERLGGGVARAVHQITAA